MPQQTTTGRFPTNGIVCSGPFLAYCTGGTTITGTLQFKDLNDPNHDWTDVPDTNASISADWMFKGEGGYNIAYAINAPVTLTGTWDYNFVPQQSRP